MSAKLIDVEMPDGTVVQDVPEGTSQTEVLRRFKLSTDQSVQNAQAAKYPTQPGGKPTIAKQGFDTDMALHQAGNVLKGIPQAITGILSLVGAVGSAAGSALSGDGAGTLKKIKDLAAGAIQPFTTSARGLGALVAPDSIIAPTDQEWEGAAQGAGANFGGLALGAAVGKFGPKINAAAQPDALMTRAANLRAKVNPAGLPLTKTGLIDEAINATRTPRATLYEKVARLRAGSPQPVAMTLPETFPDTAPPTPATLQTQRIDKAMGLPQGNAGGYIPPDAQPLNIQQPGVSSLDQALLDQLRAQETPEAAYARHRAMQDDMASQSRGPLTPQEPIGAQQPPINVNHSSLMQELANPDSQLSKAKQLRDFAYGSDPAVRNIEEGIAPSGREAQASTLRIAPELAKDPQLATVQGLQFEHNLFNKFKNAEMGVDAAEKSVPRETTVQGEPITTGFEGIIEKYKDVAPEAAAAISKLWEHWVEKGPMINWDDFIASKRKLGKDLKTSSAFNETGNVTEKAKSYALRDAYGVLMDATKGVSEDLHLANREYSNSVTGMIDAGMDFKTGRRYKRVGQPLPPQ